MTETRWCWVRSVFFFVNLRSGLLRCFYGFNLVSSVCKLLVMILHLGYSFHLEYLHVGYDGVQSSKMVLLAKY